MKYKTTIEENLWGRIEFLQDKILKFLENLKKHHSPIFIEAAKIHFGVKYFKKWKQKKNKN